MTFDSVYEILDPLTTIRKQRFWEWFSGNDLKAYWSKDNVNGTNTFEMADEVDGGFRIVTGSSTNNSGSITFNAKRHYKHDACISIAIVKRLSTTSASTRVGLSNGNAAASANSAWMLNTASATFYALRTRDGSSGSSQNSTVSEDEAYHLHKVECGSADIKLTIDGILEVTKTTNRPTAIMQPFFNQDTSTTASKTGHIRYYEVYNT